MREHEPHLLRHAWHQAEEYSDICIEHSLDQLEKAWNQQDTQTTVKMQTQGKKCLSK